MAALNNAPAHLMSDRTHMTVEEFDIWVQQQTGDAIYEFIDGKVVEVPSNVYASMLASYIGSLFVIYLRQHPIGWVSGEAGGFFVNGERYAPDIAFMRRERQRRPDRSGYNSIAPDLAVEIISSDTASEQDALRLKLTNYLLAGTVVLIVNSLTQAVELHMPGQPPQTGDRTSRITFEGLLPGFVLNMQEVFDYADDTPASE